MPAVSCRCRFPSFLYRVYQPTLRRAEASPRACVALCGVLARARARRSRNCQLWNGGDSECSRNRGKHPRV